MQNRIVRQLILLGSLIICCIAAYFLLAPESIIVRLVVGAIAGLLISTGIIDLIARQNKKFASEMAQDIRQMQSLSAQQLMKSDGSFFTTPLPLFGPGSPRLLVSLLFSLLLLSVGGGFMVTSQPAPLAWPAFGLSAVVFLYGLTLSLTIKKATNKQVAFYKDRLVFLPQKVSVPYSHIDHIEYYAHRLTGPLVRRSNFSFHRLIIRHNKVDHQFEWNEAFPSEPFDPSIFIYFGFEEKRDVPTSGILTGNYSQYYVYNASLKPSDDSDPVAVKTFKGNQQLTTLIIVAIAIAAVAYELLNW